MEFRTLDYQRQVFCHPLNMGQRSGEELGREIAQWFLIQAKNAGICQSAVLFAAGKKCSVRLTALDARRKAQAREDGVLVTV
jgi:hypothetical protein